MAKSLKSPDDLLSTTDAGAELGVTDTRVVVLINEGRLPATRIGRFWVIRRGDLDLVRDRPPGRPRNPRKQKSSGGKKAKTRKKKEKPASGG